MSNSNLHPVWAKALGITPQTTSPSRPPETQLSRCRGAAMTGQTTPTGVGKSPGHPPRPGAPVGIKKQLGPDLWVSTTVRPGDTRYPVQP
ncbi:MAG: hypothetical protein IPF55_11200 [Rhodoferax sp.]|nr:hypothetical protein [Rhodoferax sp.]